MVRSRGPVSFGGRGAGEAAAVGQRRDEGDDGRICEDATLARERSPDDARMVSHPPVKRSLWLGHPPRLAGCVV